MKKIAMMLLAFALAIGIISPITQEAFAASTVKYEANTILKGGLDYGYVFKITDGPIKGMVGTCMDPWHHIGSGSASIAQIPNDNKIARLAYYCQIKGYSPKSTDKLYGYSRSNVISHAMSYARIKAGYKTKKTVKNWRSEMNSQNVAKNSQEASIKLYKAAMEAVSVAPDYFEVWAVLPSNSSSQDGVVWKLHQPGNATLKKSNADPTVANLPGYNNFAGITYTLYKSDLTTAVGTFYVDAAGNSNTITGLAPGNYYAIESSTNAYHVLNPSWIGPVKVKSNSTGVFYASDNPTRGSAQIIKRVQDGEEIPRGDQFTFRLVNANNPSITYNLVVTGNGSAQASGAVTVYAGTYNVTEVGFTSATGNGEYIDTTGRATVTVNPGQTGTVTWNNEIITKPIINVQKTTDDNGPLSGFRFRVEGELYNQGTMSASAFLNAVSPSATVANADEYDEGAWTVDSADLAALNEAAKNRQTGTYNVKVTKKYAHKNLEHQTAAEILDSEKGTSRYEEFVERINSSDDPESEVGTGIITAGTVIGHDGHYYQVDADTEYDYVFVKDGDTYKLDEEATEANIVAALDGLTELDAKDVNVELTVKVGLRPVIYNEEDNEYVAKIGEKEEQSKTETDYSATYNDFKWNGSATVYKDVNTDEEYTILTTDQFGRGFVSGQTKQGVRKGVWYGKYTVTEVMTENQAAKYRQPESKTMEILEDDESQTANFKFTNIARRTDVKLRKTSPDGNIANIMFHLTGTTKFGDAVDKTVVTDAEGNLDFGLLYAGDYVAEEISFDPANYINNHPYADLKNPAIGFEVTGEEEEPITIEFENKPKTKLLLSKIDGEDMTFLENSEFELYEDGTHVATFQIVRNDDGTAGINMKWSNGEIKGSMSKTIIDEDDTDEESPGDIIIDEDDEEITPDPDTAPEPSGEDTPAPTPSDQEIDMDSLNYATVEGLSFNKHYVLKETRTPKGYVAASADIEFDFTENPTRIAILNYVPEISTTAHDSDTETHLANADSEVTITDVVSYGHLTPNEEYTLRGYLHKVDDNTGGITKVSPVVSNGKAVVSEIPVTADEDGVGTWDIDFDFNGTDLEGKTTVITEELYTKTGTLVALHGNPDDEGQSVHFPAIGTTATDPDSLTGLGSIRESQNITDEVAYSNLLVGETYTMKATLYDKTEGKIIGETFEKEFTPTEESGTLNVPMTVNSTGLIGHELVVFEECYLGDKLIAEHKDKNDVAQTIEYPNPTYEMYKVRRTDAFKDTINKGKYGFRLLDDVVYDVFIENTGNCTLNVDVRDEFENPGYFSTPVITEVKNVKESTMTETGVNITVESGETAVVTYTATVLPSAKKYLANAAKDSDSQRGGKDTNKVYETNSPDNEDGYVNTAYAEHPTFENPDGSGTVDSPAGDKNDPAQTPVQEPKIGTRIGKPSGNKVKDTVSYDNLKPDETYILRGYFVERSSGKKVKGSDGMRLFVPSKSSGKIDVKLSTKGAKTDVVAYEYLYLLVDDEEEVLIAQHTDKKDKLQTLVYNHPYTADAKGLYVTAALCAVALAFILRRKLAK